MHGIKRFKQSMTPRFAAAKYSSWTDASHEDVLTALMPGGIRRAAPASGLRSLGEGILVGSVLFSVYIAQAA